MQNPTSNKDDSSDKDKDSKDGLGTLKNNAVATTNKNPNSKQHNKIKIKQIKRRNIANIKIMIQLS